MDTKKGDTLNCRKDNRPEALEFDKHAIGVFKEDILVGHIPIEVSRIISYFLQANETDEAKVEVTGKRKREIGLIVPGKYYARTKTKRTAQILGEQLQRIKEKYTHFSWEYEEMKQFYKGIKKLLIKDLYFLFLMYTRERERWGGGGGVYLLLDLFQRTSNRSGRLFKRGVY